MKLIKKLFVISEYPHVNLDDFKTRELPPATFEKLHLKVKTNVTDIKTREPVEILRPEEIIHNATLRPKLKMRINKTPSRILVVPLIN
jgi:hypothetical protein